MAPDERLGLCKTRLDRVIALHKLKDAVLVLRRERVGVFR